MKLSVEPKAQGRNPHTVFCYICGREFGSVSIDIHEKACIAKWDRDQSALPKHQRRPRPKKPELNNGPHSHSNTNVSIGNEGQVDGNGGGDFHPRVSPMTDEALKAQYNELAYQTYSDQARVECPNCHRKFSQEDRLQVHLKSCKPGGYFEKKNPSAASATNGISKEQNTSSTHKTTTPLQEVKNNNSKGPGVSTSPAKSKPSQVIREPSVASEQPTQKTASGGVKDASYCTECGFHFQISEKFCPECGMKRLRVN